MENQTIEEILSEIKNLCKERLTSNKSCEECNFYYEKEHRCKFSDIPSGWKL